MPEPDILWTSAGQPPVAYELVEIMDEGYAGSLARDLSTKDDCYAAYMRLPQGLKSRFDAAFSSADLFIAFRSKIPQSTRRKIIPRVLERLVGVPHAAVASGMLLKGDAEFNELVDYVGVGRGVNGPLFDAVTPVWVGDSSVTAISSKTKKTYVTAHPMELLVYFGTNPMHPDEVWLHNVKTYCSTLDATCPFRAIYVFDANKLKVRHTWYRPAI